MTIQVVNTHQGGQVFPGTGATAASTTSSTDWYSHPVWAPWAHSVEWQLHLDVPVGAPTSGAITATFEIYIPTFAPSSSQEITTSAKWMPISQAAQPEMFLEAADWPTQVASYTATAAALLHRTLRTKYRHRLHLTSTLAGGTSGFGFPLSVRSIAS